MLKYPQFGLIGTIRRGLTCLKTHHVSRLSAALTWHAAMPYLSQAKEEKKHNSQFYFCEKIHFAKRPTTFHQRARLLLMAKVTFSKYSPARFFNQMMPSRIFFTLKTPRGSGELWFMCIHYTGEQRLYECDEHTKRSHGRSMFHIKSH